MLKQLIQKLLDSRTTPAQAGNSAMPGATKTIFLSKDETVGSWGIINAGTAPDDGYLFVNASAEDNTNSEVRAQLGNLFHVSAQAPAPKGLGVAIPVSKGATYSVEGAFVSHITVGFVKVIGGGYKCLVRRSLLCLRTSYNFSLKNSLLAEATGFPTNPIQLFKRRISHLQRQESGFLSSLLATGGSASKGLPRKFCLATGRFGRGAIQQRHLIKAFVFLSQKAGLWPTYYRQTPRAHMPSLFRVSAINSFQTGGALC